VRKKLTRKLLELKNISYKAKSGIHLDNLSFDIMHGESTLIFGPEESGISELFDIIIKVTKDYEGEVFYKDKNIGQFRHQELLEYKKDIGYVHGNYGLLSNMTVKQNIALPLDYHTDLSEEEVEIFVETVAVLLKLTHCLDERPFDLTASEILRTAFARSIVLDPDLLYIEHAFENHCRMNIKVIIEFLRERSLRNDKSLILINYSPENYIDLVDKYIMLYDGRIVFQGTTENFLSTDNPYVVQYKKNSLEGPIVIS